MIFFCSLAEIELYKKEISYNIKVFMVLHNSSLSFLKKYRNILSECLLIHLFRVFKFRIIFNPKVKRFFYKLNKVNIFFITLSHGNYNEFKKYYGIESSIIYNIIPKYHEISLKNYNNLIKKNQIVFVGRLDESAKGLTFLLASWVKIKSLNWNLLIVAIRDDSEKLKVYVSKKSIKNISFLG
jgi:hypothetical protein